MRVNIFGVLFLVLLSSITSVYAENSECENINPINGKCEDKVIKK